MENALLTSLRRVLGEDRVLTERNDLIPYCTDYHRRMSYEGTGDWPLCVVMPETTEEVEEIVKLAIDHGTPIVPRGGGSNQVEGVLPPDGAIVLSTARMNKVIDIDTINLTVTAQPGVGLREIDEILEPHGLILAQEQGSYKTANIGGALSTNGFSLRHNRYGDIGENVLSLEVVLGDGRVMRTGPKVVSNSSGYHLHKLFVAAEGTLGIITEMTLQVMPKPEKETAIGARFESWEKVEEMTFKFLRSGVNYSGGNSMAVVDESGAMVFVIIVGMEGTVEEVNAQERVIAELLTDGGGTLVDPQEAWRMWRKNREYWCGTPHPELEVDDLVMALPLQHYDTVHERAEKEIFPKYGIKMDEHDYKVITLGRRHISGLMFLYDSKKSTQEQLRKAFGELMQLVAEYGGAGPGCHAVGQLLRDHIVYEQDPVALDMMRGLKRLFDPHNIMNPGKKLPDPK